MKKQSVLFVAVAGLVLSSSTTFEFVTSTRSVGRSPANIIKDIKKTINSAKNFAGKGAVKKNPGTDIKAKIADLKEKLKKKEEEFKAKIKEKEDGLKNEKTESAEGQSQPVVAEAPQQEQKQAQEVVQLRSEVRELEKVVDSAEKEERAKTECKAEQKGKKLQEEVIKLLADKEDLLKVIEDLKLEKRKKRVEALVESNREFLSEDNVLGSFSWPYISQMSSMFKMPTQRQMPFSFLSTQGQSYMSLPFMQSLYPQLQTQFSVQPEDLYLNLFQNQRQSPTSWQVPMFSNFVASAPKGFQF